MPQLTRRQANLLLGLGLSLTSASFSSAARAAIGTKRGKPGLDHIVWVVPDLETGKKQFEQMTGIMPVSGGKAPGRSESHNALASLGSGRYLEIFAPRVVMTSGRWFDLIQDGKARLASYCLHVDDQFETLLPEIPKARLQSKEPVAMGRVRPDGIELKWKLLNVSGSKVDAYLPFFIDWLGSKPHPSEDSPAGATLERFEIRHPDADEIAHIFRILSIELPVVPAEQPSLVAHLKTPNGAVILS
jgi:hypothetical protein